MDIKKIGNTPLIQIKGLEKNNNKVYSKCEFMNPTGSHKDRTFLHIITSLEEQGEIKKGMTLVDCSTGNGGAALAWIGKEKGYKVKIFMPEGMTKERTDQIESFDAEIIETPKELFLNGSVEYAKKYMLSEQAKNDNTYFLDQGSSLLNMEAWYGCGQEIITELNKNNIIPDYFICSIGTGGTFSGIASKLKKAYPKIKTIGIEVDQSAPLYALKNNLIFCHKNHSLMGLGAGVLSDNTNVELIDEIAIVNDKDSWRTMKSFIKEEGLGIGPTCGSNLLICKKIMNHVNDKTIITLFFDSAWKYKSKWNGIYEEYQGEE